jgi:hypothetical protein
VNHKEDGEEVSSSLAEAESTLAKYVTSLGVNHKGDGEEVSLSFAEAESTLAAHWIQKKGALPWQEDPMALHADGVEGGGIICKLEPEVSLTNLHPDGSILAIATVMEVDKKATANLFAVLSTRPMTTKMLGTSKTLREGSAIMVFSYHCPMAKVLHYNTIISHQSKGQVMAVAAEAEAPVDSNITIHQRRER